MVATPNYHDCVLHNVWPRVSPETGWDTFMIRFRGGGKRPPVSSWPNPLFSAFSI
jgi:hypothetical protein